MGRPHIPKSSADKRVQHSYFNDIYVNLQNHKYIVVTVSLHVELINICYRWIHTFVSTNLWRPIKKSVIQPYIMIQDGSICISYDCSTH